MEVTYAYNHIIYNKVFAFQYNFILTKYFGCMHVFKDVHMNVIFGFQINTNALDFVASIILYVDKWAMFFDF